MSPESLRANPSPLAIALLLPQVSHKSQVTTHNVTIQGSQSQVTSHNSQVTIQGSQSQVTSHKSVEVMSVEPMRRLEHPQGLTVLCCTAQPLQPWLSGPPLPPPTPSSLSLLLPYRSAPAWTCTAPIGTPATGSPKVYYGPGRDADAVPGTLQPHELRLLEGRRWLAPGVPLLVCPCWCAPVAVPLLVCPCLVCPCWCAPAAVPLLVCPCWCAPAGVPLLVCPLPCKGHSSVEVQ